MTAKARKGSAPRDFDDIKKLASLPTRTVSLCLAGELVEELIQLELQLAEAKPAASLGDAARRLIAEQIVAVQEQMRDSTVDFRLRAMPSRAWASLRVGRPIRAEGEADEDWEPRAFGWQADMVSRACVDPVMTAEQVGELVDVIHNRAWVTLASAAFMLNEGEVDVPNSEAASELIRDSEQT